MIRLFVAVDLPETVRTRLAGLCAGVPGAKWVAPENMHLTLRFIGDVDDTLAIDISETLGRIHAPAFEFRLGEVGHFGSRGKVRALWVGIEACAALEHLHDKIESALVRVGIKPESRKFTPHVTLARLKDARLSRVRDFLGTQEPFSAGPVPVDSFALYSSYLARDGAIHRTEARYVLDVA